MSCQWHSAEHKGSAIHSGSALAIHHSSFINHQSSLIIPFHFQPAAVEKDLEVGVAGLGVGGDVDVEDGAPVHAVAGATPSFDVFPDLGDQRVDGFLPRLWNR